MENEKMSEKTNKRNIRDILGSGSGIPATSIVRQQPLTAATISKLVERHPNAHNNNPRSGEELAANIYMNGMSEILRANAKRNNDAQNMIELFPKLGLCKQIIVSSIISPKDMTTTDLNFRTTSSFLPSSVVAKMLERIKLRIMYEYDYVSKVPKIIEEAVFDKGSYVNLVIPEASVDQLINQTSISTEAYHNLVKSTIFDTKTQNLRTLGILQDCDKAFGATTETRDPFLKTSLEALDKPYIERPHYTFDATTFDKAYKPINPSADFNLGDYIQITDNFNFIKLPTVVLEHNKSRIRDLIKNKHSRNISTENASNFSKFQAMYYKNAHKQSKPFVRINLKEENVRTSIGKPLIQHVPSACFIPVTAPGDKTRQIGGFFVVDENGNFLDTQSILNSHNDMFGSMGHNDNKLTSYLLNKANANLNENKLNKLNIDKGLNIFSHIVETEIARIVEKSIGSKINIASSQDIYAVMLARTYANQMTRLVYVPAELFTYYAIDYYENGIGKSLFDDLATVISMRATMLFARISGYLKNSIDVTNVHMRFSENNPDPLKDIEIATHEILKMRQMAFPLGLNTPADLLNWVHRCGLRFSFEGHPSLPKTSFEFNNQKDSHVLPEDDLDKYLEDAITMYIGLTPEMLDSAEDVEFAKTIISRNLLMTKRIIMKQLILNKHFTKDVRTIVDHDYELREELLEYIRGAKGEITKKLSEDERKEFEENMDLGYDAFLEEFIKTIDVYLPSPDNAENVETLEVIENKAKSIDEALKYIIDAAFLNERTAGKLSDDIDILKETYKAYLMRKWMAENNFMPEAMDIITLDEDGKPKIDLFNEMESHIKGILTSGINFIHNLTPAKHAGNKDLEKIENMTGEEDSSTTSSSSSSSDSDSGESTDDGFGMGGEFNMSEDDGGEMSF